MAISQQLLGHPYVGALSHPGVGALLMIRSKWAPTQGCPYNMKNSGRNGNSFRKKCIFDIQMYLQTDC